MRDAAQGLDSEPIEVSGTLHGTSYAARLDGARRMGALRMAHYASDLIPQIPHSIYAARIRRDDEVLRRGSGFDK